MRIFTDLLGKVFKIDNRKKDVKALFYIIPALLLFILSFYADFKILGLFLFLYIISLGLGLGYKYVFLGILLMFVAGFISISRFGLDSWLMVGVQMGFAGILGISSGLFRDKYLKYVDKYRLTQFGIDNANLMTFLFDKNGRISYVNQYVIDLLGYEEDELVGQEFDWLVSEDAKKLYSNCLRKKKYDTPFTLRMELLKRDGGRLPVEVNCKYLSYNGNEYGFLFAQDITEILKREQDIDYLLYRDSLTGLYNRRFFEEEMNRLDTNRQLPIAILMVDVNGLKVINDTYGHKAGDEHLRKVGDLLKNCIRQEDILARWAGDEFVILMPNTDYEAARLLYSRIKGNCLTSYDNGDPISVAVGVAVKEDGDQNITEVLEEADKDMYQDKMLEDRNSGEHIVQFMMKELQEKSFEKEEHIERVKELALELGDRVGMNDNEKKDLAFMAQFHDIGLIMLPDDLIGKKERLDKDDWEKLRKHPVHGSRIISSLRDYNEAAENILSHHEWWNGQGYPEGLKGEEIPLASRIVAIADAYEVMTSGRPYKAAREPEDALQELKNYGGIQFDDRLVDEFIEMMAESENLDIDINNILNDNFDDEDDNTYDNDDTLNTARFNTGVEIDYGDDR